jgi:hypothetical protein
MQGGRDTTHLDADSGDDELMAAHGNERIGDGGIGESADGALAAALHQHAPRLALAGISAGLHAVAGLPSTADEQAITSQALRRSVALSADIVRC